MTASPRMTLLIHPVAALTIATFIVITAVGWFAVPGPRWALVTLGASGTLLLIAVTNVAFPVPTRMNIALVVGASVGHVIAFAVTRNTPPIMTVGDPPGRMLTYVSLQSASHAIRYRVPFPQPTSDRMRVRLILARPYAGPARLQIDVSGRSNGTMALPADGNLGEREYTFDMAPFGTATSALVTVTVDIPDPNLHVAVWESGAGRTVPDEPEYLSENGSVPGLPNPLTGELTRAWPLMWAARP